MRVSLLLVSSLSSLLVLLAVLMLLLLLLLQKTQRQRPSVSRFVSFCLFMGGGHAGVLGRQGVCVHPLVVPRAAAVADAVDVSCSVYCWVVPFGLPEQKL